MVEWREGKEKRRVKERREERKPGVGGRRKEMNRERERERGRTE